MEESADDSTAFVWNVTEDKIDIDEVAAIFVRIHRSSRNAGASVKNRTYLIALATLSVLLPLALLASASLLLAVVVSLTMGVVFWLIVRTDSSRLAKRLRSVPDAMGPGTFTASPSGTVDATASATATLAWSRYETASTVDDYLALTQDTRSVRLLPWRALEGNADREYVLSSIRNWIEAAK